MSEWDNIWKEKRIVSSYSQKYIALVKQVASAIPDYSIVLEAGCGTGQSLKAIKQHFRFGLDISQEAIDIAQNNCDAAVLGDIRRMEFPDNQFGFVYNSGVLEHFTIPAGVVAEMVRVTKKDGLVMIIVPNRYCIWYRIWKALSGNPVFHTEGHYSIDELVFLMEECGLTIEKTLGLQVFPPLATGTFELLPEGIREWLGRFENVLPYREHYAYAVGAVGRKR